MGKILFAVLLAGVAVSVYWCLNCCGNKAPPKPPPEDTWWGPEAPPAKEDTSIRPFTVSIPDHVIEDLNKRLDATRDLTPPLEGIHFQYGFNTDTLKKILKFWRNDYKWKSREAFLNQFPQFKTRVQGLDIHYIHVKPPTTKEAPRTIPLLLLHGWPGSVREFYSLIPLLTKKPIQGADFVFEVIVPSLPGYGFSQGASKPGLGAAQMAVIFKQLMTRLGHNKFYVQGGDWGSQIASNMGVFYPSDVLGLHLNMCTVTSLASKAVIALGAIYPRLIVDKENEHELYPYWEKFGGMLLETGYLHIQATKPDTVGIGLGDSPAALAGYILEKFSTGTNYLYRDTKDGGLTEKFTYEDLLDNVMIYWVTNSMTTAVRLYAESFSKVHRVIGLDTAVVPVPTWCSKFRTELGWMPDWLLRWRYPQLVSSTSHDFGGHFAAMEQPTTLAKDVWSAIVEAERMRATRKAKTT